MFTKNDLLSIQKAIKGEVQGSEKRLSTKIDRLDVKLEAVKIALSRK